MKKIFLAACCLGLMACASAPKASKTESKGYDSVLTGFPYPFEVKSYEFEAQGQKMKMAYMDLMPEGTPKKTVVLLHGKNFGGFYFEQIAKDLRSSGYRVIIPDQIGFGKSTKPESFQYSFHTLGRFTENLLDKLGVKQFILVGHSMGGMLATRLALMSPERVQKLILVNPIGLEDYKTLTSYKTVDDLYQSEINSNEEKIRDYQKNSYYDGTWKPEYEPMIKPAVGWTEGPDKALIAKTAALTADMIYTQPVFYEFQNLKMPTVLILGQRDRTAIGKGWASPANQKKMGNYPQLGKDVSKKIKGSRLIEMKGLGHMPFVEDYDGFMQVFKPQL